MSREIKFRAWDEGRQRMYYQGTPDLETIQSFMHHYGHLPLMQFTGLKDKNGREIYSNDDVRWFGASGVEDAIGIVKWDNDKSAYVVYVDDYNEHYLYDVHYADLEVIGNIHENE